jgi:hypothetical protein
MTNIGFVKALHIAIIHQGHLHITELKWYCYYHYHHYHYLPLPTAMDEGAGTTFNNKPSSGSFWTEATIGASLETTVGPCTATSATTLVPTSTFDNKPSSGSFGAEGAPPSTVATASFNVGPAGTADKFFPTGKPWQAKKKYG